MPLRQEKGRREKYLVGLKGAFKSTNQEYSSCFKQIQQIKGVVDKKGATICNFAKNILKRGKPFKKGLLGSYVSEVKKQGVSR